jgi:hypothetical protein
MECAEIKELLSEYIDDTLDPDTKALLEDHLLTCEGCKEELASLRTLVKDLGSLEPVEAPEDFLDKLHERMKPRFQFGKILRMLFVPARIKIPLEFATVAVMAVLIFSILHTQEAKKQFVDVPKGVPPVRIAKQHTLKPAQPPLKEKAYKAEPTFDEVTAEQPAEERQIIEVALLLGADVSGKAYAPGASMEAAPRLEKKAKRIRKEKGRRSVSNMGTTTGELKKEGDKELLVRKRPAFEDKDDRAYSYFNETLSTVKHLIAMAEGNIISVEYEKETGRPQSIHAEVPAQRYHSFSEELANVAPLQSPLPTISDKDQKVIRILIRFISSH